MTEHHSPEKVGRYRKLFQSLLADVWATGSPISWLDVGAGYGEVVEAVASLAPSTSNVRGLEPMLPKVEFARARGVILEPSFIGPETARVQFVSAINVLSHVNDPREFIGKLASVLLPGGELILETGDMGEVETRDDFPGMLDLPDHVGFATQSNIETLMRDNGLQVTTLLRPRIDGALYALKSVAKRLLGRPVKLAIPYVSPYRRLIVRARLEP
jgi:SAM-dependent methyltransferase